MVSVRSNIALLVALVGTIYGGMLLSEKFFFLGAERTERQMIYMKELKERRKKMRASEDKH